MTKSTNPRSAVIAGKPSRRKRNAGTQIPHELVAHQVGGHLALDFCNTAGEHLSERPSELLPDWESFLRWAAQVGLIGPNSYFELLGHPEPLGQIVELREAIYRVGLAVAGTVHPSKLDVDFIRERSNAPRPEIESGGNLCLWHPAASHTSEQLCAVLGTEALCLFCSPRAARIGVCEGGNCGWLFLDESRGKRRRWCDMNDCGSRAKARRFYERHKIS